MASGIQRLKRRPEFLRVAAARKKWVTPGLILQMRRHSEWERAETEQVEPGAKSSPAVRVGYTVSRKVGNAVARNRARRRLRAAAQAVLPDQAQGGYDFVVIGRAGTLTRPFAALVGDLEMALRRLGAHRTDSSPPKGRRRGRGKTER